MKQHVIRAVEFFNSLGFSLIVGSVIYFILGEVASLVGGEMLNWTFCGVMHHLAGVQWCGIEGETHEAGINNFVHHLLNATLPWFMILWGFVLVTLSTLLLQVLGYRYVPPGKR